MAFSQLYLLLLTTALLALALLLEETEAAIESQWSRFLNRTFKPYGVPGAEDCGFGGVCEYGR